MFHFLTNSPSIKQQGSGKPDRKLQRLFPSAVDFGTSVMRVLLPSHVTCTFEHFLHEKTIQRTRCAAFEEKQFNADFRADIRTRLTYLWNKLQTALKRTNQQQDQLFWLIYRKYLWSRSGGGTKQFEQFTSKPSNRSVRTEFRHLYYHLHITDFCSSEHINTAMVVKTIWSTDSLMTFLRHPRHYYLQ